MLLPEGFIYKGSAPSAVWCYHDAEGLPIYAVARHEAGTLDPKRKAFVQYRWDAGEYLPGLAGGTLPLYCQHELDTHVPALFVEGEKNADALRELGYTATTTPGGTGNLDTWLRARGSDLERFKGRTVYVLPDADKPGRKHARTLAERLKAAGADVRLASAEAWAHLGDTADPFDFIKEGNGRAELDALLEAAPHVDVSTPEPTEAKRDGKPRLDPAALYGFAGEFVKACRPYTEACDAGVLFSLLPYAAACMGADLEAPVYFVGAGKHHCRLFTVLCGPTSEGRKGSSYDPVRALAQIGADADDGREVCASADLDTQSVLQRPRTPNSHEGGLSTAEGLGFRIRDEREVGRKRTKRGEADGEPIIDPGEPDKRLLIVQSEFGAVLRMNQREGNTLSEGLRAFYDGHTWGPLVKRDGYQTTRPHVNILGNITLEELRELLDSCSIFNGFANRFLWPFVERSRLLPRPPRMNSEILLPFAVRLREAVLGARGRVFNWTPEAGERWDDLYHELGKRKITGRPGLVTERAAPYIVRLAMLFAALDCSPALDVQHLSAAKAAWQYCEDSAVYIFGDGFTGTPEARTVLAYIRKNRNRHIELRELVAYVRPCRDGVQTARELVAELAELGFAAWVDRNTVRLAEGGRDA
ncbi:MAG: hypothetical protein K8I27_05280 [Planctomycetes bacterium]|nr:hypothetical protein [Planctomycetota bacterium]